MQDRPTYDELLAAIEYFLDNEIVPHVEGARGFHGRVAANAIRIIRRELAAEDEHLREEWRGLDALLGAQPMPETRAALREALLLRNHDLGERIRSGERDDADAFQHVRRTVRAKLEVSNPRWLEPST